MYTVFVNCPEERPNVRVYYVVKLTYLTLFIGTGPVVAWLAVMQEGLLNLAQLSPALCHTHLNK
jgi:hypothetical protein